jgi:L-threonylcarbamoyladenylate synthase
MLITSSVEELVNLAKSKPGAIFAYPTETFYGLGCQVTDNQAVERLIRVKGRDAAKGMIVLAAGMSQAKELADIDSKEESLLSYFWPGALSAVLKCRWAPSEPARFIHNGTIAIRVSPNPLATELARLLGPVISTSANPSGMKPADCIRDVISYGLNIDAILDGGKTPGGLPSTLIDFTGKMPVCLRQGVIPFEKVLEYWKGLE